MSVATKAAYSSAVPAKLVRKTCFEVPIVVNPVPPLVVARVPVIVLIFILAVLTSTVIAPLDVTGPPLTVTLFEPAVTFTLVTVPTAGEVHTKAVPPVLTVSTCPAVPIVVIPVPPCVVLKVPPNAVKFILAGFTSRVIVPFVVIGPPLTDNLFEPAVTAILVTVPEPLTVDHSNPVPPGLTVNT